MTALVVCDRCRGGEHPHDRYTQGGGDAGCPFTVQVLHGRVECQCPVKVHIANVERRPHCPTCTCS